MEIEIRKAVTWDRPSWKFGTMPINQNFQKAFDFFDQQKNKVKNFRNKKLDESDRSDSLDSTLKEVKTRYKVLAKKWHPDAQQNIKNEINKDKFVIISNAYKTILKSFTESKKNK